MRLRQQFHRIGSVVKSDTLSIINATDVFTMTVSRLRDVWYKTSFLLDQKQTANGLAEERYKNYKNQPLRYTFPENKASRRKLRRPVTSFLWNGRKDAALRNLQELYNQLLSEGKQALLEKRCRSLRVFLKATR